MTTFHKVFTRMYVLVCTRNCRCSTDTVSFKTFFFVLPFFFFNDQAEDDTNDNDYNINRISDARLVDPGI